MTAAGSEASLCPSCCCMVQHSRREVGEALHSRAAAGNTGKVHLYLELSPKICLCVLAAYKCTCSSYRITENTYLFKVNSQNVKQFLFPTMTNQKQKPCLTQNPRASQEIWSWENDFESDELWEFCCSLSAAFKGLLHPQTTLSNTRKPLFYLNTHP